MVLLKVIHLADLHLGRSILEQSLIEDQKYILDEIIKIIVEKEVEVVLICGDVYDKSVPSIEAVCLFNNFLTELSRLKKKVFIISGNHDSKDRLSFGNELFKSSDIYIEGVFNGELKKVTIQDEYGNINIYMLPFVKPAEVRCFFSDCNISSYNDMVKCIIDNSDIDIDERNIIMVHQFVTASGVDIMRSDSEILSLGGLDNVDVSSFSKFDYVAMGHIHGGQKLIRDTVRYAGSPLKYSFSEVHQKKSVPVIDLKGKGDINIELIDLDPLRDMRVIKGPIDKLLDKEVIKQGNVDDYINAILMDEDYVIDAIGKLRGVYKNILKIDYSNLRSQNSSFVNNNVSGDIRTRNELDLFSDFYKIQNNIDMDEERVKVVRDIIKEIKNG